ncbi:MAG TPA: TAXI family TRAP transporter solute-binding subunit [Pseudolabrys sp.]|nr:TAXI family TRAP transporter solute-binding subunit [Pseudolabrys sp.]
MLGFSRWQLLKGIAFAAAIASIVSLALIYFIPAPPSKVTMATAFKGSAAEYYGLQYREIFARSNIEFEVRQTAGTGENLKLLQDPKSGVQIGLMVSGVSDGKRAPGLLSLGAIYNTPFWLFYSSKASFDRLSQLEGKRIAAGPVGSGSRSAAEQILGKAGVNSENSAFLPFTGSVAVEALNDGKVDAVWTPGAPDSPVVRSLLQNPNVRIMNFPTAEALTIIFPEFVRLVLPRGVIDIKRDIPPNDVPLIGTTAKVLVRGDLHPEIVQLLLQAMVETHGARGVFQRGGEFPNGTDTEYPVAPAAIDFYKNGPSFMQRHLPLSLSVHAQRAIAVLVTAIAIGFPLFRFLPVFYNWITRRRLFYWYAQLKALEASFDADPTDKHLAEKQSKIEQIEDAVSHIRIPLTFSDQVYNLRSHIDIVRRKISSRNGTPGRIAAE